MLNRRSFLALAGLATFAPFAAQAADNGFLELLSGVKDRSEREYFERHRAMRVCLEFCVWEVFQGQPS